MRTLQPLSHQEIAVLICLLVGRYIPENEAHVSSALRTLAWAKLIKRSEQDSTVWNLTKDGENTARAHVEALICPTCNGTRRCGDLQCPSCADTECSRIGPNHYVRLAIETPCQHEFKYYPRRHRVAGVATNKQYKCEHCGDMVSLDSGD